MYLEQKNTGGRDASPTIPKDARAIQVGQQIIIVISIAGGFLRITIITEIRGLPPVVQGSSRV